MISHNQSPLPIDVEDVVVVRPSSFAQKVAEQLLQAGLDLPIIRRLDLKVIAMLAGIAAIWLAASDLAMAAHPIALSPADAEIVDSVHTASLARREANLRSTIAQNSVWPHNLWGDNLWCLAALYLNEEVDDANARLLNHAHTYNAQFEGGDPAAEPWISLGMFDYARTLSLFHSRSTHFPSRLAPATETAMKEAVWNFVSRHSLMVNNGLDSLFVLMGTENHDLNYRPFHYLMLAVLSTDPSYAGRKLADGHSLAEHLDAYTAYFRQWPRFRAMAGLWVEIGSNTYQKYSWPALFNLHELSPDPIIREQFGKLLDLAFIEEEQISVRGWRGGGRSRAGHGAPDFLNYKHMLLDGTSGGSSHSRVMETSTYQAPAYAILLRHRAFPAAQPFVIRNIVPGEVDDSGYPNVPGEINHLRNDPAQANYAYRTPHYLLGSTLMNPQLVYSGISWQNRVCGMLFHDPDASGVSQVHPHIEHSGGGRPQNPFFTIQHQNVLLLQRIARRTMPHGSYNTDRIMMRFTGADLHKTEQSGWIFTTNGKAYVAVRFLDGGHVWNEAQTEAFPANYSGHSNDTTRILMHAGDITEGSFEAFQAAVLANPLTVTTNDVDYRFGSPQQRIQVNRYVASSPQNFAQPRINGITQELRPNAANPLKTFDSPYLSMDYGSGVAVASYPGYEDLVLDFDASCCSSGGSAAISFDDWIAEYHTAVEGLTGFDEDPDGDGIPNGIEAWFGTRPDRPSQGLVVTGMGEGSFTFSHPENPDMPNDMTVYYEWSPDLVNWYRCDGTSGPPDGTRVTVTKTTVNAVATLTATVTSSFATNRLFLKAVASQD